MITTRRRRSGFREETPLDPTAVMRPVNWPVRLVTRDGKAVLGRRQEGM